MVLKIGLTGGIGSGKSEVSARFAALGVPIIDTDRISRELVAPGQPALAAIAARFGDEVIAANGQLDRATLRRRVFDDAAARHDLEALLHPRIRREIERQVAATRHAYVVIVVPLLFEAGFDDLVDRVLVVDVPEATQRARVLHRDGDDPQRVTRIIATQLDRRTRLARADDVIDNARAADFLDPQIEDLHARYLALAASPQAPAGPA